MKNNDISIERSDLFEFISKCRKLKVPYFQREYTWDKKQIRQLIDDVSKSQSENYYIGTIVISHKNGEHYIIDGQQRISTLILILNQLLSDHDFIDENNFKDKIKFKSFLDNFSFESMNIRDGNHLDEIIHRKNDLNQKDNKYYDNDKCIYNEIKLLHENNLINKFIENFNNIIFSLVIVYSPKIDENILFEKINSTGIPLSQYDLSKNYLLSKIWSNCEENDKNEIIEKYSKKLYELTKFLDLDSNLNKNVKITSKDRQRYDEDNLIRFFIAFKTTRLCNKEEIYDEFKNLIEKVYEYNGLKAFEELKKFAFYYQYVFDRKWKNEIFQNQMQLIEKQFNTFIVLVIRILEMNSNIENENIVFNDAQKQEINKLLLVLECYIYRRTYVKLPEKVISRKMSEIKLNKNNYANLEEQLFYELYKKDKAFRMPSFEEFCENVYDQNRNFYSSNKNITQLFLYRLGTFDIKEKIENEKLTIEHVIPQTYEEIEEYNKIENVEQKIHVLGNLTLTAYNSEYSNSSFHIKKEKMLSKDNFPLNKYFINLDNWNIEEIDKRTKYLLNKTKEIWNYSHYEVNKNQNTDNIQANNNELISKDNHQELKAKYKNINKFKTALSNASYFKKIDKKLFNYEQIKEIIEDYVLDGISYEEIEKSYFNKEFHGWLGKSILQILEIQNDKNKILSKEIESYILSKENNINELIEFVNDIK